MTDADTVMSDAPPLSATSSSTLTVPPSLLNPSVSPVVTASGTALSTNSSSTGFSATYAANALALVSQNLVVDRILRQRTIADEIQYRVKWKDLQQQNWVTREQLFWKDEETVAKLEEFEEWATAHPAESLVDRPEPEPSKQANEGKRDVEPTATKSQSKNTTVTKKRKRKGKSKASLPTQRKKPAPSAPPVDTDADATDTDTNAGETHSTEEGDDIYEVEALEGDVWEGGIHWYRVKWLGYSDFDNSWQRPEDLIGCAEQLQEYWKKKKERRKELDERDRLVRKRANEAKKKKTTDPSLPPQAATSSKSVEEEEDANHGLIQVRDPHSGRVTATILPSPVAPTTPTVPAVTGSYHVSLIPAYPSSPARSSPTAAAAAAAVSPSKSQVDDEDGFQLFSFATLQAAQQSLGHPAAHEDGGTAHATPTHASVSPSKLEQVYDAEKHLFLASASAPSATAAATSSSNAVIASEVPMEDSSANEDDSDSDNDSTNSISSTSSLLLHPQHKHVHDQPQCILAHDWYECPNDESTWLLLVKWKHRPVAEASWEPRDSIFLTRTMSQKRLISNYLKTITDAHIKNCIQKNTKP